MGTITKKTTMMSLWICQILMMMKKWTLTGDAPVVGTGDPIYVASPNLPAGGTMNWSGTLGLTAAGAQGPNGSAIFFVEDDPDTGLKADLSGVTAATVNELRLAMALQRYEEARARWGSRYTEYLRYLGVKSSDARLQRPEYLGGGKQTIQFSEVLQTAPTTSGSADGVGNLLGHGIGAMKSSRYRRFFEEHGYVFSFMVVRPRAIYADGVARTWNRRTKEDFFQKELQHIGQQEVLNKEVYADAAQPNGVFGYQDRYDEYRREESRIAGEFATVLSDWNMARIFDAEPVLNDDFVTCVPTTRIYQSTATDQLYCMIQHSIQASAVS